MPNDTFGRRTGTAHALAARPLAVLLASMAVSLGALADVRALDAAPAVVVEALPADGHIAGHVIVRLAPGAALSIDARSVVASDARGRRVADVEDALARVGVRAVAPALAIAPANVDVAARVGLDRFRRLMLAPGRDAAAVVAMLRDADSLFDQVELDPLGGLASDPVIPNDPNLPLQWGLLNTGQSVAGIPGVAGADIAAPEGWSYTTGEPIVVAVLDSGVNNHTELSGRVLSGMNIPNPGGPTTDGCGSHGTHVSGILGARGDNATGIAGVHWTAEIVPVIVVNPCQGPESLVADGLVWAADAGVKIANMSLQYTVGSAFLKAAVEYADALGVIMIAATGNNNTAIAFPARWPETIAVGATNHLDERWFNSNFGPEIDLVAPGVSIWSLTGTASYGYKTGTSMAVPHVAGAVALMLTLNPTLTSEQVRQLLRSTADDIGAVGFDELTGYGRLNLAALLAATMETVVPTADLNGDGIVDGADLGIMLNNWGPCGDPPCIGDLDGNGTVDGADLGLLLNAWGDGPPS